MTDPAQPACIVAVFAKAEPDGQQVFLGSGTLVGPRHVVTCWHLFRDGLEGAVEVRIPGVATLQEAEVWRDTRDHAEPLDGWDAREDLALLTLAAAASVRPGVLLNGLTEAHLDVVQAHARMWGYPGKTFLESARAHDLQAAGPREGLRRIQHGGLGMGPGASGGGMLVRLDDDRFGIAGLLRLGGDGAFSTVMSSSNQVYRFLEERLAPGEFEAVAADQLERLRADGERSKPRADWRPDLPANWVPRPEVDGLVERLLATPSGGRVAVTASERLIDTAVATPSTETARAVRTALRGAGGFGKTAVAIAACHDDRVGRHFTDGISWVTLGQTPNLVRLLNDLLTQLTGDATADRDLREATAAVRAEMRKRAALLVLDDVWEEAHARPFLSPQGGAVLLTTRIGGLSNTLGAEELKVDRMARRAAGALLLQWVPPEARKGHRVAAGTLARKLGDWPLLLKLVGGFLGQQVRLGRALPAALATAEERLDVLGPAGFVNRERSLEERERSIDACLMLTFGATTALEAGPGGLRARFEELAVFAEDADIPHATVRRLWFRRAGLDRFKAEDLLMALNDLALFDRFELNHAGGSLRLHDVVRSLLRRARQSDLRSLDQALVDAYDVEHFADLPPGEPYIWDHLASHLQSARGREALRTLLFDPRWLHAKVSTRGVGGLLEDFRVMGVRDRSVAVIEAAVPDPDRAASTLFETLQFSAHIIRQHPRELTAQLLGRLPEGEPDLKSLRRRLIELPTEPWLRPLRPTFEPAGGALLGVIPGDSQPGNVKVMPDGLHVLTWPRELQTPHSHLWLWNLSTGICAQTFEGHDLSVGGAQLFDDGWSILSWSPDGTSRIWDGRTGRCLQVLRGHRGVVNGAVMLDDDSRVLSWSEDGSLRIWLAESATCQHVLTGHEQPVIGALVLRQGARAVSWSQDGALLVWDLVRASRMYALRGHQGVIAGAVEVGTSGLVLSWGSDAKLRLWDTESGASVSVMSREGGRIIGAMILDDQTRALSWSADGALDLWTLRDGTLLHTLAGHEREVTGAALMADGTLLSWGGDGTLRAWRSVESDEAFRTFAHPGPVTGAAILPDQRTVLGWTRGELRQWDLRSDTCLKVLASQGATVEGARVLSDRVVLSWGRDHALRVWDLTAPAMTGVEAGSPGEAIALAGGRRLLTCSWEGGCVLWDAASGDKLRQSVLPFGKVIGGASVEETSRALFWSSGGEIAAVDAANELEAALLGGHTARVQNVEPAPGGRDALSWDTDGEITLWDLQRAAPRWKTAETDLVAAALVGDGRWMMTGHWQGEMKLWNAATGEFTGAMNQQHGGRVLRIVALGPSRALSWGIDSTLRVWDLDNRTCAGELIGHQGRVGPALAFGAPARVVTWGVDQTLRFWELARFSCYRVVKLDAIQVEARLLRTGKHAITWGLHTDNTILLWDLERAELRSTLTVDSHPHSACVLERDVIAVCDRVGRLHWIAADSRQR